MTTDPPNTAQTNPEGEALVQRLRNLKGTNPTDEDMVVFIREWNKFRQENPGFVPDLQKSDLSGIDLAPFDPEIGNYLGINLSSANLVFSNLNEINLTKANMNRAHVAEVNLKNAKLQWTDLTHAHLNYSNLANTNLSLANLKKANLTGSIFRDATILQANLRDAEIADADFSGASLEHAEFHGAFLLLAEFQNTKLKSTDFRNADLRDVKNLRLDSTLTAGALFSPNLDEPWTNLRRKYTGSKLLFHLLLMVAFFLPLVGKTFYWTALGQGQEMLSTESIEQAQSYEDDNDPKADVVKQKIVELGTLETIGHRIRFNMDKTKELDYIDRPTLADESARQFAELTRATSQYAHYSLPQSVHGLPPDQQSVELATLQVEMGEASSAWTEVKALELAAKTTDTINSWPQRRVFSQLIGFGNGSLWWMVSLLLITYNALRFLLTINVGHLREEEERTGTSPPYEEPIPWKEPLKIIPYFFEAKCYKWLHYSHKLASILIYVGLTSAAINIAIWLIQPVHVPPGL